MYKWCQSGSCVRNDLAPEAKDICQHGDRRGTVFINDTRTCRDFQTAQVTWHCYSQVARGYCCDSCSDVYNASDTGCLYGDKAPFCINITRRQCYGKTNQNEPVPDVCCRKCREFRGNINGCLYGDKAPFCVNITRRQCYGKTNQNEPVPDVCCIKCRKFRGNINGCLYGDKAPFCVNITRRQCYDKTTQNEPVPDVCCRKCREFRGNINGCPYGDRAQNCRKKLCSNPENIINCCETCASPDSGSTTETTPEQQLPVVIALPLEIKINAPFDTLLTDSNTLQFKNMSNYTCYPIVEKLDSAYSQYFYIRCKVLSFRNGSVIADTRVDFLRKSSNTKPPLTDIKDNINNTFQTHHMQLVKLDLMFDECHSPDIRVTCSRYADCLDETVGYSCHCILGYRNTSNGGDSCAESCEKVPCKNDGKCMENQDGPVSCQCAEGFEGPRCERVLVPTWHEPVIIGGVCDEVAASSTCIGMDYRGNELISIPDTRESPILDHMKVSTPMD
ncbi:neurogenic locus notch homolog protein 1 [Lingula anatina]|uniref:Neurogenic locus notch homolog protein 1 n=1 Tax=Lingula anatina TaxID=7574 RepID=A0A1S3HC53_LINAN|nr:neurogenic locus notch homolog protein 1 [Lingula anatina]|eukprot:XP_013383593.1 neurogenic locus notch homolog protein 1 [Lingula anatina]